MAWFHPDNHITKFLTKKRLKKWFDTRIALAKITNFSTQVKNSSCWRCRCSLTVWFQLYFHFLEDINLQQYIVIYHSTKVAEQDRKYLGTNLHVPKWLATDWAGIVRTGVILATETVASVKLPEIFPSEEKSGEF